MTRDEFSALVLNMGACRGVRTHRAAYDALMAAYDELTAPSPVEVAAREYVSQSYRAHCALLQAVKEADDA